MALTHLEGNLIKGDEEFKLSDEELIGIYFSAHWCPPCRGFTPELAKFYTKCKDSGKKFEIVFVSSDRDEASFKEYYGEMPWAALKFEARDAKAKLAEMFSVRGIPSLIILNKAGETVEADGRGKVMGKISSNDFTFSF